MNQYQSLSIEWENVASCLSDARNCVKDPDTRTQPFTAIGPFQETIVALAYAVNTPNIRTTIIATEPILDGAFGVLERFFSFKLGGADQKQSLETAQKILNNATYFRRARIASLEDAKTYLEAIIALVNIVAGLSEIEPELLLDAG